MASETVIAGKEELLTCGRDFILQEQTTHLSHSQSVASHTRISFMFATDIRLSAEI